MDLWGITKLTIIQSAQKHSLLRDERGCLALPTHVAHAVQSCIAKVDIPNTKRQSRQSFINHDQNQNEVELQSARNALHRLLSGLTKFEFVFYEQDLLSGAA